MTPVVVVVLVDAVLVHLVARNPDDGMRGTRKKKKESDYKVFFPSLRVC